MLPSVWGSWVSFSTFPSSMTNPELWLLVSLKYLVPCPQTLWSFVKSFFTPKGVTSMFLWTWLNCVHLGYPSMINFCFRYLTLITLVITHYDKGMGFGSRVWTSLDGPIFIFLLIFFIYFPELRFTYNYNSNILSNTRFCLLDRICILFKLYSGNANGNM